MTPATFFVVGAQKAGTSAIDAVLRSSGLVHLPSVKETKRLLVPNFLDSHAGWYFSQWSTGRTELGLPCGEVDPDLLHFDFVPGRVKRYFPSSRIVVVLRDPVARALSHYRMTRNRGLERLPFDRALRREPARLGEDTYYNWIDYSYWTRSEYSRHILRWYEELGGESVLLLRYADLVRHPEKFFKALLDHIGVGTAYEVGAIPQRNVGGSVRSRLLARVLTAPSSRRTDIARAGREPGAVRRMTRGLRAWNSRPFKETVPGEARGRAIAASWAAAEELRLRDEFGLEAPWDAELGPAVDRGVGGVDGE